MARRRKGVERNVRPSGGTGPEDRYVVVGDGGDGLAVPENVPGGPADLELGPAYTNDQWWGGSQPPEASNVGSLHFDTSNGERRIEMGVPTTPYSPNIYNTRPSVAGDDPEGLRPTVSAFTNDALYTFGQSQAAVPGESSEVVPDASYVAWGRPMPALELPPGYSATPPPTPHNLRVRARKIRKGILGSVFNA